MPETTRTEYQRVPFRMFQMPCCGTFLCWVNPRNPSYCPECGSCMLVEFRAHPEIVCFSDQQALLEYQVPTEAKS